MLHACIFINLIRCNANVIVLQFLVHLEASSAITVQTATSKYIYTIKCNALYAADLVTSSYINKTAKHIAWKLDLKTDKWLEVPHANVKLSPQKVWCFLMHSSFKCATMSTTIYRSECNLQLIQMVSSVTHVMYHSNYIRKKTATKTKLRIRTVTQYKTEQRNLKGLEKQDTQGKDGRNNFTLWVKE